MKVGWVPLLTAIWLTAVILAGPAGAAEIITDEDIRREIVTSKELVRSADNAILILDASSSMSMISEKYRPKTRYELQKQSLTEFIFDLPDIGFNVGIYSFTPWTAIYPVQPFDRSAAAEALAGLPKEATGRTPLMPAFSELETLLKQLSGKTVVYIFTDGGYDRANTFTAPGDKAAQIAASYDVCFRLIDHSSTAPGRKTVRDMGKANPCSRVIDFDAYIRNPQYALSPLYYVKTDIDVVTVLEKEIVGIKMDNLYFGVDKAALAPGSKQELNALGSFLQEHSDATAYFFGYTDSSGEAGYNMKLSRRRAEAAVSYIIENFDIDPMRLVSFWYGEANPARPNVTAAGRAGNRRVEIVVGG